MCYIIAACVTWLTTYSKNMFSTMWITIYTLLIIIKIHFKNCLNTTTTSELGFSGITYLKSLWSCCSSFTSLTLSPLFYKNNHTGFIHKDPISHQNYIITMGLRYNCQCTSFSALPLLIIVKS